MKTKHSIATRRLLATRLAALRTGRRLPYRTIGEALERGDLPGSVRNAMYRHYKGMFEDKLRAQCEAAGRPYGHDEWNAAIQAARDLPLSVLLNDLRTADLTSFRNVGKKGLAHLRALLT